MSISKDNYNISFDTYGNLYFEDKINTKVYQLNVDGKNIPYLDQGQYKVLNKSPININTFVLLDKNTSLKARIKKIQANHNMNDDDDYNSDDDFDLEGDGNVIDYYPEDNDHYNNLNDDSENDSGMNDEDKIKMYGSQNLQFNFWASSPDSPIEINYREDGDITALYDVYIYDEHNNLIFKSTSKQEDSIYRLRIFYNGDIYFRPIGYTENRYILKIDDSNTFNITNVIV